MAKENNTKIIVTVLIILALLFLVQSEQTGQGRNSEISIGNTINNLLGGQSSPAPNSGTDPITDFISVRMYDQEGNLIDTNQGTFSIVNNIPGVFYIDLTVTATNTGSQALSCNLPSLSPSSFRVALPDVIKAVPIGGKAAWTSGQIAVQQFESAQGNPTVFSATVRCTTSTSTLPEKTGTLSIVIKPEASGDFTVDIDTGGAPTEFCGDNICQVSESPTTCPADCVVANNVKFRTTELGYISGSAIGYTSSCGTALTKYGYSGTSGSLSGDCTTLTTLPSYCGTSAVKLFTVPSTSNSILFKPAETDRLCVCRNAANGNYNIIKYLTGDADASLVDGTPTSFDIAKEVAC